MDILKSTWQQRFFAAESRIGHKPLELFAWLLRFVQHDPDELRASSPADLAVLDVEAHAFAYTAQRQPKARASIGGVGDRLDMFADGETLAGLVETLRPVLAGIQTAMASGDGGAVADVQLARFGQIHFSVTRMGARSFEPLYYCTDPRDAFILLATDLIASHWPRVRQCAAPNCGRWFVRRKRGLYCSPTCQHRVFVQTWRNKMGEPKWKDKRKEYYRTGLAKKNPAAARHLKASSAPTRPKTAPVHHS